MENGKSGESGVSVPNARTASPSPAAKKQELRVDKETVCTHQQVETTVMGGLWSTDTATTLQTQIVIHVKVGDAKNSVSFCNIDAQLVLISSFKKEL